MYRTLINLIGRRVTQPQPVVAREKPSYEVELAHLRRLRALQHLFPQPHVEYLQHMKRSGIEPRVIYDVGANVLHWTHAASTVWPGASYFAFEAMDEAAALYAEEGIPHHMGVLSDRNGREVKFYVSPQHPGGNSYYKENSRVNRDADTYFPDSYARVVRTVTLDTAVRERGWPCPDLIKMDVQGAEMDVLMGAQECLKKCKNLILELQTVEYNRGAPLKHEVISYLGGIGYGLVKGPFHDTGVDGDYQFTRCDI